MEATTATATATTTTTTVVTIPTPTHQFLNSYLSIDSFHQERVVADVEVLSDGSLVSCGADNAAVRWFVSMNSETNHHSIRPVSTFVGSKRPVACVVERDEDTFVTGCLEGILKVWDKNAASESESLHLVVVGNKIYHIMRTKDKKTIIVGLYSGVIEMRRASDLSLIKSLNELHVDPVNYVCELEDGSFVSGSHDMTLKRWSQSGLLLQTHIGHTGWIYRIIELESNLLVTASFDRTIRMWKLPPRDLLQPKSSSEACIRTLCLHSDVVYGLVKVSSTKFVSGSYDNTIRVWDAKGECLETVNTETRMSAMTLFKNAVVTLGKFKCEIRMLR